MTMITPVGGNGEAEEILCIAEKHLGRMLYRVEELIAAFEAEETTLSKEAVARIRELSKAAQTAFDERAKIEKLRKNTAGIVHDYALDFDAARFEIGRRIARLRDARGTGGISGQPE